MPAAKAKERLLALQKLQADIQLKNNRRLIGQTIEVLIVEKHPKKPGEVIGRSESYRVVNFPSRAPVGAFTRVKITGAGPHSLRGERMPARRTERGRFIILALAAQSDRAHRGAVGFGELQRQAAKNKFAGGIFSRLTRFSIKTMFLAKNIRWIGKAVESWASNEIASTPIPLKLKPASHCAAASDRTGKSRK